jgi:nickel superoxide dismutase
MSIPHHLNRHMVLVMLLGALVAMGVWLIPPRANGHCQIPCGIYDDDARFTLLAEHVETMVKSAKEIQRLTVEEPDNANQLTRWVLNKEQHADAFTEIVVDYFLTQRIKPAGDEDEGREAYVEQLTLAHQLLVGAMKVKQTDDPAAGDALGETLAAFQLAYEGDD